VSFFDLASKVISGKISSPGGLTRRVVCVGSGPGAMKFSQQNLSDFTLVAINNAWRVRNDFSYCVFPSEFPLERRPPPHYATSVISTREYMKGINAAGGIIFAGATMAFAAGYWLVDAIRPDIAGYYACDMIYGPGKTHFYGQGAPDPLRDDITLRSLEAKGARLFAYALLRGTLLLNLSDEPETRLVFPRGSLSRARQARPHDLATYWSEFLKAARKITELEAMAPFDALQEEYWLLADTEEKQEFLKKIDHCWLGACPLIDVGWSRYLEVSTSCLVPACDGLDRA
jgi:hypothetical protein